MNDINNYLVEGYLVKNPEHRQGKNVDIAYFTIASHRDYKKHGLLEEDRSFFACEAFNQKCHLVLRHARKGSKVKINAHLKQYRWEQGERWVVVVDEIYVYPPKFTTPNLPDYDAFRIGKDAGDNSIDGIDEDFLYINNDANFKNSGNVEINQDHGNVTIQRLNENQGLNEIINKLDDYIDEGVNTTVDENSTKKTNRVVLKRKNT